MQITLSEEEKDSILHTTGIPYDEIILMDIEEIHARIEEKIGKKLRFRPIKDQRLIGRGSPYIYLNRLFPFDEKEIKKYIKSLK